MKNFNILKKYFLYILVLHFFVIFCSDEQSMKCAYIEYCIMKHKELIHLPDMTVDFKCSKIFCGGKRLNNNGIEKLFKLCSCVCGDSEQNLPEISYALAWIYWRARNFAENAFLHQDSNLFWKKLCKKAHAGLQRVLENLAEEKPFERIDVRDVHEVINREKLNNDENLCILSVQLKGVGFRPLRSFLETKMKSIFKNSNADKINCKMVFPLTETDFVEDIDDGEDFDYVEDFSFGHSEEDVGIKCAYIDFYVRENPGINLGFGHIRVNLKRKLVYSNEKLLSNEEIDEIFTKCVSGWYELSKKSCIPLKLLYNWLLVEGSLEKGRKNSLFYDIFLDAKKRHAFMDVIKYLADNYPYSKLSKRIFYQRMQNKELISENQNVLLLKQRLDKYKELYRFFGSLCSQCKDRFYNVIYGHCVKKRISNQGNSFMPFSLDHDESNQVNSFMLFSLDHDESKNSLINEYYSKLLPPVMSIDLLPIKSIKENIVLKHQSNININNNIFENKDMIENDKDSLSCENEVDGLWLIKPSMSEEDKFFDCD